MGRLPDNNEGSNEENSVRHEHAFIALCAEQLRLAIGESRAEMDGLTASAVGDGEAVSMDLITRLQSVDRLMQRLSNVQVNLERLARFLDSEGTQLTDAPWTALLKDARASFTMEQEREMFDSTIEQSKEFKRSCSGEAALFDD